MNIIEIQKYLSDIKNDRQISDSSNWVISTNPDLHIIHEYPNNWDTLSTNQKANFIIEKWAFETQESKNEVFEFVKSLIKTPLEAKEDIDASEHVRDFIYEMY